MGNNMKTKGKMLKENLSKVVQQKKLNIEMNNGLFLLDIILKGWVFLFTLLFGYLFINYL
jgi:hypothetical protein